VIGVIGAGDEASDSDCALAERLGERLAEAGWIVLTGGRDRGVMAAASRGAKRVPGSLTIGILPSERGHVARDVDVAVFTGMGNARNAINVLSSRVVVACGRGGPGTASEIALALKSRTPVVLLAAPPVARDYFVSLGGEIVCADSVDDVIAAVYELLAP
jgi:uncharacterized protein (TIGR00725 family)